MYRITLRIERLPEGVMLGTSEELPGLVIQADTAEAIIRLAPDLAADLIAVMRETGQAVPHALPTDTSPLVLPLIIAA